MNKLTPESSAWQAFVGVNILINNILTKLAENETKLKLLRSLVEESGELANANTANTVDVNGQKSEGDEKVGGAKSSEVRSELFNKYRTRPSSSDAESCSSSTEGSDHLSGLHFNRGSENSNGRKDDSSDNDSNEDGLARSRSCSANKSLSSEGSSRIFKPETRSEEKQKGLVVTGDCFEIRRAKQDSGGNFDSVLSSASSSATTSTQRYQAACIRGRTVSVKKDGHMWRAARDRGGECISGGYVRVSDGPVLRACVGDNASCGSASVRGGFRGGQRDVNNSNSRHGFNYDRRGNMTREPNRFSLVLQAGRSSQFSSDKWFVFIAERTDVSPRELPNHVTVGDVGFCRM